MSKPHDEFKARQNPLLKEQMDKPSSQLHPAWSEDEYILISDIWKIFKNEPGTNGKKKALEEVRKFIKKQSEFDEAVEQSVQMVKNFTNGYLQCIEDMVDLREIDIAVHNRLVTLENGITKRAKDLLQ